MELQKVRLIKKPIRNVLVGGMLAVTAAQAKALVALGLAEYEKPATPKRAPTKRARARA